MNHSQASVAGEIFDLFINVSYLVSIAGAVALTMRVVMMAGGVS